MELIFLVNNNFSVETSEKYKLIGWQLESLISTDNIISIMVDIETAQKDKTKEWHMSFNSTFLSIIGSTIKCSNLYDENDFLEIDINQFKRILNEWLFFVKESKNKRKLKKIIKIGGIVSCSPSCAKKA